MKKIYIILFDPNYDAPSVVGVFKTLEEAEAYVKNERSSSEFNAECEDFQVHEVNVPWL